MTKRVLVIGGYGTFGSVISRRLCDVKGIKLIIAGRSAPKAGQMAAELGCEWAILDINAGLEEALAKINPDIVIHTSGPYQGQGYDVALACIAQGAHYIDLADARGFVANIDKLDAAAKRAGVLVVGGASSVPALTSAILDRYIGGFDRLESVDYGITTAQRATGGAATAAAVLGYAGKTFQTLIGGKMTDIVGWQDITSHDFPQLGRRWLSNCDIPDLALFPVRYPDLKTIRFRAGIEVKFMHAGLWALTWLVRAGLVYSLRPLAGALTRIAGWLDFLGTDRSGFYMVMQGQGLDKKPKSVTCHIIARSGDGPNIPCMPAILVAQKLAKGKIKQRGAMPCMGLITLDEYLTALGGYDIEWLEAA